MKSCETVECQDKPQQFNIMCIINDVSNLKKGFIHRKNQAPGDAWSLTESDTAISQSYFSFLDNLNYSIVVDLFQV